MIKRFLILLAVFSITVLFLSACGSGGSNSNPNTDSGVSTITVTAGSDTTVYTEGYINNSGYYDPSFSADCYPTPRTLITMCGGVSGSAPCDVLINISASDIVPGTYPITGGSSTFTYILYSDNGQDYDSVTGNGTVTISSVGNVGEPITGSFDAELVLRTDPLVSLPISGTFSVTRDH